MGERALRSAYWPFLRLKFFLMTEPHATTLLDLLRAHLEEDIARAARAIEAFGLGRDITSEYADELKRSRAHKEYKAALAFVALIFDSDPDFHPAHPGFGIEHGVIAFIAGAAREFAP